MRLNRSFPDGDCIAKKSLTGRKFGKKRWEERSFSRDSEWIEVTPGGGRLPGEEWNKQLQYLLGSKWSIWIPVTLVATCNRIKFPLYNPTHWLPPSRVMCAKSVLLTPLGMPFLPEGEISYTYRT